MPSEEHIVQVHDMPYAITISQRSKIAWLAVGEYTGTYIEAVGPSAAGWRQTLGRCSTLQGHWESGRRVVPLSGSRPTWRSCRSCCETPDRGIL